MAHRLSYLIKHTTHTTTVLFIVGFVIDIIILPDIDHPITRYIGLAHICVVASLIMFREWIVSRNTANNLEQKIFSLASFGISFSSGAALSFICIYAFRSAALSVSWPLFVLLLLCIVANEFVSTHTFRFTLDVGILLIASLFFIIFNIPILLKIQNDTTFAISICISIVISLLYLYFLQFTSESARYEASRTYALAIGIPMFVGMLYFLNVIPAVPLSLKSAGVYHSIVRVDNGDFIAIQEEDIRVLKNYRMLLHHVLDGDDGIYFFSNIDTPADLTAPISHTWEYYDITLKKWIEVTKISFDIQGGRDDGYRAYSKKENINEGLWRVTVKIGDNRIIGREKFQVIKGGKVDVKEVKL